MIGALALSMPCSIALGAAMTGLVFSIESESHEARLLLKLPDAIPFKSNLRLKFCLRLLLDFSRYALVVSDSSLHSDPLDELLSETAMVNSISVRREHNHKAPASWKSAYQLHTVLLRRTK